MFDKTVLQNGGILKSVPDFYKNQEMCNKAINNYPHALELVPECYKPPPPPPPKKKKICDVFCISFYS